MKAKTNPRSLQLPPAFQSTSEMTGFSSRSKVESKGVCLILHVLEDLGLTNVLGKTLQTGIMQVTALWKLV